MANFLGLDIGDKRIGVAIADVSASFPAPLTTLEASEHLAAEFKQLLHKHTVTGVVIGLPRNQSGERTKQTDRVEHIAKLLKIPKNIPVYWQDESLTSVKAEAELKKRKKPYAKAAVDALAATYILEDFVKQHNSVPAAHSPEAEIVAVPKKAMRTKKILLIVGALLILIVGSLLAIGAWYLHAISSFTTDDKYSVISIKNGDGASVIADELQSKGVIRSSTAFKLYIRLNNISNLQAGDYRLSSKQSAKEIASILSSGKVTTVNILIPPGLRLDQIVSLLEKDGFAKSDIEAAIEASRDHPVLAGVPADAKLEGYLFPDTYQIGPGTSARQLIDLMLDTFEKRITDETRNGINAQGLTLFQAVTIASVVQKEVPDYATQQKVAQVFLKRFKEGMPLGADPTFKYAAAVDGGPADPSNSSPYNTRKVIGLPPTPISNFNISALNAVANPADANYLYFVSGDNGITYFSNTFEEHQALINRYCKKLCN